jgi:hypothetical protein
MVYDISDQPITHANVESSITSIAIPNIPESIDERFVMTDHACGVISFGESIATR